MAKVNGTGPEIDCCLMPASARRSEAQIYRSLRDHVVKAHCAAKRDHMCCGQVTITRAHLTLNCALCGDLRQILTDETAI